MLIITRGVYQLQACHFMINLHHPPTKARRNPHYVHNQTKDHEDDDDDWWRERAEFVWIPLLREAALPFRRTMRMIIVFVTSSVGLPTPIACTAFTRTAYIHGSCVRTRFADIPMTVSARVPVVDKLS